MTIAGILHTGLTVSDLDRSLHFYVDLLGLRVIHRQVNDNEYTRRLVGVPNAILRVALLQVDDGNSTPSHIVELIEYVQPKGDQIVTRPCDFGATHLCFRTTDCIGLHQRLAKEGVEFVNPPVAITAGINKGGYGCYLRDPDGFILEFLQPPTVSN